MTVFYILLTALLFWKASAAPTGQFHPEAFSRRANLPLRGFFTLLIVFHHLSQQLAEPGSLRLLQGIGPLCVSYFFFESGYGLMKSLLTKEHYFRHFFRKRCGKLLLPFFLSNLIYLCVNMASGISYSPLRMVKCLTGLELINTHAWFILTILLFYLAFYLIFRFCPGGRLPYILLLCFQLFYAAFCMQRGSGLQLFEGPWWFNSSSPFLAGVLFARFESILLAFIRKNYRLLLPLNALSFLLFYGTSVYVTDVFPYPSQDISPLSPRMLSSWFSLLWQSLAVMSFCMLVMLCAMKVKCSNRLLGFLGKVSPELYLIHGLFIQLFRGQLCALPDDFAFIWAVLFGSAAAAALLHALLGVLPLIPASDPLCGRPPKKTASPVPAAPRARAKRCKGRPYGPHR